MNILNITPDRSGFLYLASPYTHKNPAERHARFVAVCDAAAYLMHQGHVVFSPIAHSHPIDNCFCASESGDFWKAQDVPILRHASRLVVLRLPGWEESAGIKWEMEIAHQIHLPVNYMDPLHAETLLSEMGSWDEMPAFLKRQAD